MVEQSESQKRTYSLTRTISNINYTAQDTDAFLFVNVEASGKLQICFLSFDEVVKATDTKESKQTLVEPTPEESRGEPAKSIAFSNSALKYEPLPSQWNSGEDTPWAISFVTRMLGSLQQQQQLRINEGQAILCCALACLMTLLFRRNGQGGGGNMRVGTRIFLGGRGITHSGAEGQGGGLNQTITRTHYDTKFLPSAWQLLTKNPPPPSRPY